VNLGPTSWVDAAGVVRGRYESPVPGVLIATPALLEWAPTPFDRFGDLPLAVSLGCCVLAALARQKRRGRRP
jgi:apolipoprotein N-acyltransferase